jgi:hypothetical protein
VIGGGERFRRQPIRAANSLWNAARQRPIVAWPDTWWFAGEVIDRGGLRRGGRDTAERDAEKYSRQPAAMIHATPIADDLMLSRCDPRKPRCASDCCHC